jgi:D-alanyl-D-alanine carboxypeptidase (penicillin-binding protein 5/6)
MRNPVFRMVVATKSFVGDDYYMHNLNPLLYSYEGADGVKIGYTGRARQTMVTSDTRDGHRVFVAVMRSENMVGDTSALLDWFWRSYGW